ncbi:hypothetical protein NPX13_g2583 [Xylaria arbuscula]|uniref:Ketoreductase domain-containing protein n=1 Tax=Xylaria arbuscula TaxID=114810 RepID=A0A9W8NJC4_9PEZI|nr:hypothetical protein NPX13_g2583 [Xylaria arbuscula]
MAAPTPSYTKVTHSATYAGINPRQPNLSTTGKVVVITGASGGIGRGTSASFAASGPRALILLGRRADALNETAMSVRESFPGLIVQTHQVDLCDTSGLRHILNGVSAEFGIDILVHCAGVLAPVVPLLEADPATFLDGYKTTVVGTLNTAQAVTLANKDSREIIFINLTTAGILFPPFKGMGAYVSSKMAAVKLLQAFAAENPHVRLHNVHPGFLDTAMSTELSKSVKLPFSFDDCEFLVSNHSICQFPYANTMAFSLNTVSLPADFLVWIASPEASFLQGKLVFSSWDVDELKARKKEIIGGPPGTGELWLGFQGFPRYIGGQLLPGA